MIRYAVMLVLLVCVSALGQQQLTVENSANILSGEVAAGSLVLLAGPILANLDSVSAQLLPAGSSEPLSLQVQKPSPTSFALLAYLPRETPLGKATITLIDNGKIVSSGNVEIVATSFGLYTVGFLGPALAQNVTARGLQPNNLTHPAHPLDYVTLWGTGLGTATAAQVTVIVAGHRVQPSFAGPSPQFQGLDQINFQVPDDPAIPGSCYVSMNVQIGKSTSNQAPLSLSRGDGPCRHPFGLSADQMSQLDAGGQIYLGLIDLTSGITPNTDYYGNITGGYVRTESASAQFSSYDTTRMAVLSLPSPSVYVIRGFLGGSNIAGVSAFIADDSSMGCENSSSGFISIYAVFSSFRSLNVGDKVTVNGPAGKTMELAALGFGDSSGFLNVLDYRTSTLQSAAFDSPDQLPPPFLSAGQWQASAPGSTSAQPFSVELIAPNPIQVLNYDQAKTIDRAKDVTVKWDSKAYSDVDYVKAELHGPNLDAQGNTVSTIVTCRVPATAGQVTFPAALLASFVPSPTNPNGAFLQVFLDRKPETFKTFSIKLNDGTTAPGVFRYHSLENFSVEIQ